MKKIIVLGASGSIGVNTIDIIKHFPNLFELVGFSVHNNIEYANELKSQFPSAVFIITSNKYSEFSKYNGSEYLKNFIDELDADVVVNAISGAAGLKASVFCLSSKKNLALANKESLVMAGQLLKALALKNGVSIIPIDSEHSAIFALINAHGNDEVEKIIITASGGPFRKLSREQLKSVTLEDALKHPSWNMGAKITVDSASLANKALEVIEAVQLFDVSADKIEVTVHPKSIVHSMVQLKNGAIYAQMSPPDMRFPIFSALQFPDSAKPYVPTLDFSDMLTLTFEPPRWEDFPLLKMGFKCAKQGSAYPIAFNAANEVAVEAFLNQRIHFLDIVTIVEKVLEKNWIKSIDTFDDVFCYDNEVRLISNKLVNKLKN